MHAATTTTSAARPLRTKPSTAESRPGVAAGLVTPAMALRLQRAAGNRAVTGVVQRKLISAGKGRYHAPKDPTTSYRLLDGSPEWGIAVLEDDAGTELYFDTSTDAFVEVGAFEAWLDTKRAELKGHLAPKAPAPTGRGRRGKGVTMSLADFGKPSSSDVAENVAGMSLFQVMTRLRPFDSVLKDAESKREMREQHEKEQERLARERERTDRLNVKILAQAQAVIDWALLTELPGKSYRSWESYTEPVPHQVGTKVGELWKLQAPKTLPATAWKHPNGAVWARFRMPQYKVGTEMVTGNLELFVIRKEDGNSVQTEDHVCNLHLPVDPSARVEV